jgi:hypothetical protein
MIQLFPVFIFKTYLLLFHRSSSVGIVSGYGLEAGVPFPAGLRDYSPLHSVQTGSGAHPASNLLRTVAHSPGVKRLGHEDDGLPRPSTEVKNGGAITPLPRTSLWVVLN